MAKLSMNHTPTHTQRPLVWPAMQPATDKALSSTTPTYRACIKHKHTAESPSSSAAGKDWNSLVKMHMHTHHTVVSQTHLWTLEFYTRLPTLGRKYISQRDINFLWLGLSSPWAASHWHFIVQIGGEKCRATSGDVGIELGSKALCFQHSSFVWVKMKFSC